jgi:hypothetical protein
MVVRGGPGWVRTSRSNRARKWWQLFHDPADCDPQATAASATTVRNTDDLIRIRHSRSITRQTEQNSNT